MDGSRDGGDIVEGFDGSERHLTVASFLHQSSTIGGFSSFVPKAAAGYEA